MTLVRDTTRQAPGQGDDFYSLPPDVIPIHPNTFGDSENGRARAILAAADFPLPKCVVELAYGALRMRVPTTLRDCSSVLSVPTSECVRLKNLHSSNAMSL